MTCSCLTIIEGIPTFLISNKYKLPYQIGCIYSYFVEVEAYILITHSLSLSISYCPSESVQDFSLETFNCSWVSFAEKLGRRDPK